MKKLSSYEKDTIIMNISIVIGMTVIIGLIIGVLYCIIGSLLYQSFHYGRKAEVIAENKGIVVEKYVTQSTTGGGGGVNHDEVSTTNHFLLLVQLDTDEKVSIEDSTKYNQYIVGEKINIKKFKITYKDSFFKYMKPPVQYVNRIR